MSRLSRAREGGGYVDYFANLGMWTPVLGTADVATGGGFKALTAANQGNNLVSNGEFTTDTTGWTLLRSAISQVNSAAEPGTASGGADNGAIKVVTNASGNGAATQSLTTIIGSSVKANALCYVPDANATVNAGKIALVSEGAQIASENSWLAMTVTGVMIATSSLMILRNFSGAENDIAYFDSVTAYRQNTLYLHTGPTTPDMTYIWALNMPALGVVPRGLVVRYTDPLNYWEVRIKPGTAGDDTDIVEVVAGVETVRATADIDWSTSAIDRIKITLRGAAITVEAMKSGASAFTAASSYATMATGLTQSRIGYMAYGLPSTGETYSFEVVG